MAGNHERGFPLLIGVSGHRDLDPASVPILEAAVVKLLRHLVAALPSTRIRVLSGMAAGADLVVARAALAAGVEVEALLPMPLAMYVDDFEPEGRSELEALLRNPKVRCIELTPPVHPVLGARDESYQSLGSTLARRSSLLIAAWDGHSVRLPGGTSDTVLRYLGCQTELEGESADAVFAPAGRYAELGDTVAFWVPVRRASDEAAGAVSTPCYLTAAGENRLNVHQAVPKLLWHDWQELDRFNGEYQALAAREPGRREDSLLAQVSAEVAADDLPLLAAIDSRYAMADALAMHYQTGSDRLFRLFATLTLLMGCTYLAYEILAVSRLLLLVYLGMLAFSLIVFRVLGRKHWFSSHLACRTLAESLRVKFFLALAGADHLVYGRELMTLSGIDRFAGFGWIRHVLNGVERTDAFGATPMAPHSPVEQFVERAWIGEQYGYFTRKVRVFAENRARVQLFKRLMFALMLVVVLGLVFAEQRIERVELAWHLSLKELMMFVWGSLAVALGAWELHQDKMATSELLWQYRNQLEHFARARDQLKVATGTTNRLRVIAELGRDSLMESFLWAIHRFHREHEPPSGH
jgi:hypothetical protein